MFITPTPAILIAHIEQTFSDGEKQLFLKKFPIRNKKTNSPIYIKTKKAMKVNYRPLVFGGVPSEKVKLINTGK